MFVPVPPPSDQPAPPLVEPVEAADMEADAADDEADELDLPALRSPTVWPAVARWARLCRVLAFVALVICGFLAARNLYLAAASEPQQLGPFVVPPSPAVCLGYALLWAILAVAFCISLLGFAELLHVFMSIEAGVHRQRDREPPQPE